MISYQLKQRFNNFRKAMQWTWKDIDTLTGRKHARTNISKRVPAWAMLGIHAHERYQDQLFVHLIQVLKFALGSIWRMSLLSDNTVLYMSSENPSLWVDLKQNEIGFRLRSNSTTVWGLKSMLATLYKIDLQPHWDEEEDPSVNEWLLQPRFDGDLQQVLKCLTTK